MSEVVKNHSCSMCSFKTSKKANLRAHLVSHTDEQPFKCSKCSSAYKRQGALKTHMLTHSKKGFSCDLPDCDYKACTIWEVRGHQRRVHDKTEKKPYSCTICEYKCQTPSILENHVRSHTGEQPFKCDHCNYSSARAQDLKYHKLNHHSSEEGDGVRCRECDFACSTPNLLWLHRKNAHGKGYVNRNIKMHKCNICSKAFATRFELTLHTRTHLGEKPFECNLCPRRYTSKTHLTRHTSSHTGEKPHRCSWCDYSCREKHQLTIHQAKHTEDKPFSCRFLGCGLKFKTSNDLYNHKFLTHEPKPFPCPLCEFSTLTKSRIESHMTTHTGERHFQCDQCKLSFKVSWDLKNHKILKHSSPTLLSCSQCNYSCKLQLYLKAHVRRVHEAPVTFFQCDQCERFFESKSKLENHKIVRHSSLKLIHCSQCTYTCKLKAYLNKHVRKVHN